MSSTSQKNSFVSIAEQVQQLNNNNVEFLTGINNVVSAQGDSVNVTYTDEQGVVTTYALPTVGKLHADINTINNNIKRLIGENDTTTYVIDGNSTKKIYQVDLNKEPNKINSLSNIQQFSSTNNWFFESLMNPMLSINFDLTDKIQESVDGTISRRYIVKFEVDSNGEYTENGLTSRNSFVETFVGKDNINMNDFITWYTNPTNKGVINNSVPVYDEQIFNFEYQEVVESGVFSVLNQQIDTINNKLWYSIYPYTYTVNSETTQTLKVNDEFILNKDESNTRWKIVEISTSMSNFRVRLERIEGYEPIITGTDVLKIYGSTKTKKIVKVSIGFNEYLVVFMKPLNSKNKLKGSIWSTGTGLYTNDLKLDTNNNISMSQYYLDTVSDYGSILNDLIEKNIPSKYGVKPNATTLDVNNFKVVQINKHLTDTDDANDIRNMHSQKNNVKSKLEQVRESIIQKNKELATKTFTTIAERTKSNNELRKLTLDQETFSKNYYSITREISGKSNTIPITSPKFRVRGFWTIPDGKTQGGYKIQEIVQFKIQYRYSSKNGTENQTEGYNLGNDKTGYFSNWTQLMSDARRRIYNEETYSWEWEMVDVSDADTPNINQLDIPINPDEKVEIRVKSISEVGYPDTLLESDWSNVMIIEFPDNLKNILSSNDFILTEAKQDNLLVEFEQTLEAKGINTHVSKSYSVNDEYIAHPDNEIQTVYKDDNGTYFNLREYLDYLTSKISNLEAIINSTKGELKITLYNGFDEVEIKNGTDMNIDVILQNKGTSRNGITFKNKISIIKDYYIKISNLSTTSTLGFLVKDAYSTTNSIVRSNDTTNLTSLADKRDRFIKQEENQYIYFCDNAENDDLYEGSIVHNAAAGNLLATLKNTTKITGLSSDYQNQGSSGNTNNELYPITGKNINIGSNIVNEWFSDVTTSASMATVICPQVDTINDLIVTNSTQKDISNKQSIIIPINIYWIFQTTNIPEVNLVSLPYVEHNKKIKARLHPTSSDKPFNFTISFNIKNKKT